MEQVARKIGRDVFTPAAMELFLQGFQRGLCMVDSIVNLNAAFPGATPVRFAMGKTSSAPESESFAKAVDSASSQSAVPAANATAGSRESAKGSSADSSKFPGRSQCSRKAGRTAGAVSSSGGMKRAEVAAPATAAAVMVTNVSAIAIQSRVAGASTQDPTESSEQENSATQDAAGCTSNAGVSVREDFDSSVQCVVPPVSGTAAAGSQPEMQALLRNSETEEKEPAVASPDLQVREQSSNSASEMQQQDRQIVEAAQKARLEETMGQLSADRPVPVQTGKIETEWVSGHEPSALGKLVTASLNEKAPADAASPNRTTDGTTSAGASVDEMSNGDRGGSADANGWGSSGGGSNDRHGIARAETFSLPEMRPNEPAAESASPAGAGISALTHATSGSVATLPENTTSSSTPQKAAAGDPENQVWDPNKAGNPALAAEAASRGEMRVALQTDQLGSVELHARIVGDQLGAAITVERKDAHTILATELPALQQSLSEKQLRVEELSLLHGSAYQDPKNMGHSSQQQTANQQPQAPHRGYVSLEAARGTAGLPMLTAASGQRIFDSSGRLSVHA